MKYIHFPSRDQCGRATSDMFVFNFLGIPSETSAKYISQWSRGFESNAILFPSGDQCGLPLGSWGLEIWTRLLPSALLTHTLWTPDRSDANAICFPSGEY